MRFAQENFNTRSKMNKLIGIAVRRYWLWSFPLGMLWAAASEDSEAVVLAGVVLTVVVSAEAVLTAVVWAGVTATRSLATRADLEDSVSGALTLPGRATWIDRGATRITPRPREALPRMVGGLAIYRRGSESLNCQCVPNEVGRFQGMPTDAGVGHMASASTDRGFEGTRVSAGRVEGPHGGSAGYVSGPECRGTAVGGGIEGGRVTAGRVEGPRGGSAAFVSRTRLHYIPHGVAAGQGRLVRNDFNSHSLFTPAWYTSHATAWGAAILGASAWAPATWSSASDWVGCDSEPEDYDYGSTVLYQGDNVYMEGQRVGSDTEYYDQASSLRLPEAQAG